MLLASLLFVASCGANQQTSSPATPARVSVDNRSSLDVDVFVHLAGGTTARLGFAPGNQMTVFALAPALAAGAGTIRLEARPVRGSGEPVWSEPFDVRAGDTISWSIPPQ